MHQTFNYLQRVFTLTQNMGKHRYSITYTTIPELYVVNTRATLCLTLSLISYRVNATGSDAIVHNSRYSRFESFREIKLHILKVCSPAFLTAGRLAISRRPSLPSRARKRPLSRLQFTYSYHISPYSLSYVLGVVWGAITTIYTDTV